MSFEATGAQKDSFVMGLAALVVGDSNMEVTAENLNAVVAASGNKIPSYYAPLFATYIEKAGGVSEYFGSGPSAGGGAPAAAAGGAAAAPAAAAKPVEEEVDALEGGMDMFGGGGGDY